MFHTLFLLMKYMFETASVYRNDLIISTFRNCRRIMGNDESFRNVSRNQGRDCYICYDEVRNHTERNDDLWLEKQKHFYLD